MLRCFSSLGCPGASLGEALDLAARHAIPAVELRTLGGTVDLAGYLAATYGTPARLAAHLRERHPAVHVVALNASLRLADPVAADRDELATLAAWAEGLRVRWLRVFDGGRDASDPEIAAAVATLAWWRELRAARGWNVDVMVETHDSLLTATTLQRFLAAAPDARLLWDSHHTWRKGGEDPAATWPALRAHVVHVHAKDSLAVPSARHPFTYVLPGDGEFPMPHLRATLAAGGYAGLVSLEWERQWHPYLPPLEDALRTAAARAWW
jgi:sugar phosphate isomerase/epimerase